MTSRSAGRCMLLAAKGENPTPLIGKLDSEVHFYNVAETKDEKFRLYWGISTTGLCSTACPCRTCRRYGSLPSNRSPASGFDAREACSVIKINTRADCGALMVGKDACYAPVLSLSKASEHIQDLLRNTFVRYDDVIQPAPIQHCSRACLPCLTARFMRRRSGWCRIR